LTRLRLIILLNVLAGVSAVRADDLPEYRLKAEYIYRFAQYTEWPAEVGDTINLCVHGTNPFGAELALLQGKAVENRTIAVMGNVQDSALGSCQIVFVASASAFDVSHVLEQVKGRPVLVVADAPGAARFGVTLNMVMVNSHIAFEANTRAAQAGRINLSSRLLRLATEVIQ
jgi:YfiR/HmsC-like